MSEWHPAQKVVSSLAMALLEENLKKGRSIFIPSLGIEITPEDYKRTVKDVDLTVTAPVEA